MRVSLLFLLPVLLGLAALPGGLVHGDEAGGGEKGGAGPPAFRSVTWLDRFGNWKVDRLKEVVSESDGVATVRDKNGKTFRIPFRRIDELVREGPEQKDLLAARRDARHGRNLKKAAVVLDRYAKDGANAWIKECAVAWRAVVAARRKAPDAEKQLRAFLKAYPGSRQRARVHLELARVILATGPGKLQDRMMTSLVAIHHAIRKEKGSLLLQYETYVVGSEAFLAAAGLYDYATFRDDMSGRLTGGRSDLGPDELLVVERTALRMACVEMRGFLAEKARTNAPATDVRAQALKVLRRCGFQQPQLKAEVYLILGHAHLSCGDQDAAKAAYAQAREAVKNVPDPYWREQASAAADKLR